MIAAVAGDKNRTKAKNAMQSKARVLMLTLRYSHLLFELLVEKQLAELPSFGNPAISLRPVAFRPRLATGLAFSAAGNYCKNYATSLP
jgi:hypothetical protein